MSYPGKRPSPPATATAASILCALLLLGASPGWGAPPENADGRYSEWFRSLKQPGTGTSCCDLSDCRGVSIRVGAEGYEALLTPADFPVAESRWVAIPQDKILQGKDNPLGRAVLCWTPSSGVLCFVQGAGS